MKSHRQPAGQPKRIGMWIAVTALAIGTLVAGWVVGQARAQQVDGQAGKRPVLFLGNESLPPMSFMKQGKPTGIVIDLAKALAKRMHRPVEIQLRNWAEAQQMVLEGRADALLQIDPNPERLKIYDFSESLLNTEFTIFASAERSGVATINDLRGLKVGVEKQGLPISLLQKDPQIIVKVIPDFLQGFRMLATGDVDAVVADRWVGRYVLAENDVRGVKLFDIPISQSHSAIAVKKGNTDLLGDINGALADIRRDGTFDRIIESWEPKEIVFKTREQLRQQVWLIWAIGLTLILALVGVALLTREVRRRRRVEATLRESEHILRLFIEHAPAAIAMFDRSMKYMAASRRWLSDYRLGDENIIGRSHYEMFPEIPEQWRAVHQSALAGVVERCEEDPFPRLDGRVDWVRWQVLPWYEQNGDVGGIIILTEDITKRKEAEEIVQTTLQRFYTVLSGMYAAILLVSEEGRVELANQAICDYFDLNELPDDLKGLTSSDLLAKIKGAYAYPDEAIARILEIVDQGKVVRNEEVPMRNGRVLLRDFIPVQVNGKSYGRLWYHVDITERKRAEEEIAQTNEKLDQVLRSIQDDFYALDRDWNFIFVSTKFTSRIGKEPKDFIGRKIWEMFPNHIGTLIDENFRATMENREIRRFEMTGKYTDAWYSVASFPSPEGITVLGTEITERKRMEEELRKALEASRWNEDQLRVLMENVRSGVALIDDSGRFSVVNRAFLEMFGLKSDADILNVNSQDWSRWEVYGEDSGPLNVDDHPVRKAALTGKPVINQLVAMCNPDATDFTWMLINAEPLLREDGTLYRIICTYQDITDRKRAEEALSKAYGELELRVQERTAQLLKSEKIAQDQKREIEAYYHTAPIGLCILDTDLRYLRINELLAGWNGVPVSEHLGRTLREVLPWLADEAERVASQVMETGNPVTDMEISGETPDQPGIQRMWQAGWHPMKDSTEKVVNLSVVVEEVTQQRKLEDQLRQSQKMEAIGTLAGGVAHDFNNILAAILGFTEMAVEDAQDRPEVVRSLDNVLKSAMRARELVKQILSFSRKTNYERSPLSLSPLVKETVRLLRASIPSTVEIKVKITARWDHILAAPIEIQQILMNLATNASLAMQEKGGVLEVSLTDIDFTPDSPVLEADVMPGEYVQLTVKDTGMGMTPDVMRRVFEPFFTTREVGKGTGMGLAVVYGIVKDLRGSITVESSPGVGSTFRVFLPKVQDEALKEETNAVQVSGGTERILFVDDEEMLTEWGHATLERLGYTVTAVNNSKEALNIFSSDPSRFDLVITDYSMPGMTGVQISREFFKLRPDIPVILCTGHSETVSPEVAKEAGIKEYLMKPLAKQELAQAVRRVLAG